MEERDDWGRIKESKWFEIFRTGKWNGETFDVARLQKWVENFIPGDPDPSCTIGHLEKGQPEKPALAFLSGMKLVGRRLMAKIRDVDPELVYAVNSGRFPKRSIHLWENWGGRGETIVNLAFLGGTPPGVSGMADMQFSAKTGKARIFCADLTDKDGSRLRSAFEGLPDKQFAATKPKGGESEMTQEEIQKLIDAAVQTATTTLTTQFSAKVEALEAKNAELEGQNRQFAAKMVVQTASAALTEARTFSAQMQTEKKLPPAVLNAGFTEFVASLNSDKKLKFSASTGEETQLEAFKRLFSAMPSLGKLFTEQAGGATGNEGELDGELAKFAAKEGIDPKLFSANFEALKSTAAPRL